MRRRVLATLILVGLLWIALPAVVLAGDCMDDRGWYCLAKWVFTAPLLAAAVGAVLAGAALWRSLESNDTPPEPPEMDPSWTSYDEQPPAFPQFDDDPDGEKYRRWHSEAMEAYKQGEGPWPGPDHEPN
jgi:hypothetical protein